MTDFTDDKDGDGQPAPGVANAASVAPEPGAPDDPTSTPDGDGHLGEAPEPGAPGWQVPHGPPPPLAATSPPAPAPYRRLYRSRDDRKLGGVGAGIAEYFGLDPTIVRLAILLLAFTGVAILVYIAAWLIIPERPVGVVDTSTPYFAGATDRGVQIAAGVAAIALAIGIISGSWALLAFALIGGGVWLLSQQPGGEGQAPHAEPPRFSGPPPTSSEPLRGRADRTESGGSTTANERGSWPERPVSAANREREVRTLPPKDLRLSGQAPSSPPPYFATPPAPDWSQGRPPESVQPRQPQTITRVVLSLLALLAGIGITAAAGDWWDVSATRFVGIGVVTIGVGVVLGVIRKGGARGLIPLGILGLLALIPVAALDGVLDDGVGDKLYRPLTLAELESEYRLGIGELTIDLSQLDLDGETRSLVVELGMGEATVILPPDVGGRASLDARAGEIVIDLAGFDVESGSDVTTDSDGATGSVFTADASTVDGINIDSGPIVLPGDDGELLLDVHLGFGVASLEQAREADMRFFSLLAGLVMITAGIIAIAGGDLWSTWPWILAAGTATAGIAGLVSVTTRR